MPRTFCPMTADPMRKTRVRTTDFGKFGSLNSSVKLAKPTNCVSAAAAPVRAELVNAPTKALMTGPSRKIARSTTAGSNGAARPAERQRRSRRPPAGRGDRAAAGGATWVVTAWRRCPGRRCPPATGRRRRPPAPGLLARHDRLHRHLDLVGDLRVVGGGGTEVRDLDEGGEEGERRVGLVVARVLGDVLAHRIWLAAMSYAIELSLFSAVVMKSKAACLFLSSSPWRGSSRPTSRSSPGPGRPGSASRPDP